MKHFIQALAGAIALLLACAVHAQMPQAPEVAAKAQAHADRMAAWPKKKVPDLPGCL